LTIYYYISNDANISNQMFISKSPEAQTEKLTFIPVL